MSKFFIPRDDVKDDTVIIRGDDVKHISKVLRYTVGDEILCCDGMGYDYSAVIDKMDGDKILCSVKSKTRAQTEANVRVTLIQGVPKASKMDYIIQKTTELGISDIYPCEMSRCVAKINDGKKVERWQKIAREAAKQSGRGIVPTVHAPIDVDEAAEILRAADVAFVPYECAEGNYLKPILKNNEDAVSAAFMIGPEGGFDKNEIDKLRNAGIPVVSLGKRILRTETAGEAVLSMVMYEIGDING